MKERIEDILSTVIPWSLAATLLLIPVYFAWFHENYTVFDLNKSVVLRLFITIALIAWLGIGAVSGKLLIFGKQKLSWVWLSLIAAFLISSLLSLHPIISLLGSYERQQGFINLLPYALFFFFLVTFIRTKKDITWLLLFVHISAALVCVYGIMQVLGIDFLRWSESAQTRIFSSFGQPNFFGHYLAVIIPLSVYALFFTARSWYGRSVYAALVAVELLCLIFTYSRSAWVALTISGFIAILMALWHFRKKVIAGILIAVVALGFVLIVFSPLRSTLLKSVDYNPRSLVFRAVTIFDFSAGSAGTRLLYWSAAWNSFAQAPIERKLFGHGPDTLASVFVSAYQSDWGYFERLNSFPDRAHNAPLDFLLQFGLAGVAAFISLLIVILAPFRRVLGRAQDEEYYFGLSIAAALIAYGINNLFSFSLTAMAVMLFFLLAIAERYGSRFIPAKQVSLAFFQPLSRFLIAACLSILLIVLYFGFSIRPFVADMYYMKVKRAEAVGNCRVMLDTMEKVLEWYSISHFYSRIYLLHAVNCFAAIATPESRAQNAQNILDQAASLNERESQFYAIIDLAHAYSMLGYYADKTYYQKAEYYYLRLLEINKNITVSYQDYARMKLWQGKTVEARAILQDGLAVTPSLERAPANSGHLTAIGSQLAYFHDLIGLSYYNDRNFPQAISEYEKAIAINPTLSSSYRQLAAIAYQQGNVQKAIAYNVQAFDIDPTNSVWPVGLATIYLEQKDYTRARYYVSLAANLDPENATVKKLQEQLKNK